MVMVLARTNVMAEPSLVTTFKSFITLTVQTCLEQSIVNLHLSRSEINQDSQRAIRELSEHSVSNQRLLREQSEHLNQSHTVGA